MKPTGHAIAGIILAAGASQRMGTPKALLRYDDGATLLARQCALLADAGCARVGVVVGAEADRVREAHAGLEVDWIESRQWELGQFFSLQAGLRDVHERDGTGGILLPIDTAGVPTTVIMTILETALRNPHLDAIVPEYRGRGGHPLFLSAAFGRKLLMLDPATEEARLDLQLAKSPRVLRLPVNDPRILANVNTVEEWAAAKATR